MGRGGGGTAGGWWRGRGKEGIPAGREAPPGRKQEASPVIFQGGSGKALRENQKRGARERILATNRSREIYQISLERIDLRVQIVARLAARRGGSMPETAFECKRRLRAQLVKYKDTDAE